MSTFTALWKHHNSRNEVPRQRSSAGCAVTMRCRMPTPGLMRTSKRPRCHNPSIFRRNTHCSWEQGVNLSFFRTEIYRGKSLPKDLDLKKKIQFDRFHLSALYKVPDLLKRIQEMDVVQLGLLRPCVASSLNKTGLAPPQLPRAAFYM